MMINLKRQWKEETFIQKFNQYYHGFRIFMVWLLETIYHLFMWGQSAFIVYLQHLLLSLGYGWVNKIYTILSSQDQYICNMLTSHNSSAKASEQSSSSTSKVKQFAEASTERKRIFTKKLQSIQEYIELLEKREVDIRSQEIIWDKNFLSNELKAAVHVNYHLIKLFREQEMTIQRLTQQIVQKSSRPKDGEQQIGSRSIENRRDESNKATPIKRSQAKSAFGAEKQILSAKHQKECDEYRKVIRQLEQTLKNNREENDYLRGQLLLASDKIVNLSNAIETAQLERQSFEQEKNMLLSKIKQSELKNQTGINQINCSPIVREDCKNEQEEQEISFSQEYFVESHIETKLLKRHIEELQSELRVQTEQNYAIKRKMESLNQNMAKIKSIINQQPFNKLNIDNIILEYRQIKEQLSFRLIEIENYRRMVEEMKAISKSSRLNKDQPQQKEVQVDLSKELTDVQKCKQNVVGVQFLKVICPNCCSLSATNDKIKLQNQDLREKLNSVLNFQLAQRKQWETFFHGINIANDK